MPTVIKPKCIIALDQGNPGLALFTAFRAYIEHEDELIHQRLNWVLLLEGFLFAAHSGIRSALIASDSTICAAFIEKTKSTVCQIHGYTSVYIETSNAFIHVSALLGYLIGWFSLAGVQAARKAIDGLQERWKKEEESKHFPEIIGGGQPNIQVLDSSLPYGIPLALCCAWAFIGFKDLFTPFSVVPLYRRSMFWLWLVFLLITIGMSLPNLLLGELLRMQRAFEEDRISIRDKWKCSVSLAKDGWRWLVGRRDKVSSGVASKHESSSVEAFSGQIFEDQTKD